MSERRAAASIAAALAICALLAGCAQSDDGPTAARPARADSPSGTRSGGAAIPVVTATAIEKTVTTPIEAVGTAMAREAVDVTSKVSNTITRIAFVEGQQVARGALLVELDSAEVDADLAGADARLAESRRQFARSRDLAAQRVLSEAQLDEIESTLKTAQADVAAARARRANTVIRAPFAGRTGFRRVSVGGLVSPGTVITTLDDTSVIKLEFTVPESQIYVIDRGLPVTARTTGLPGRVFDGELTAIDARVDPESRSLRVRAEIANRDGVLKPGMFMNVQLAARASRAVVVPEAAIVPEQGESFVYVVGEDDRASRRQVSIGRRRRGEVEIAQGLTAGDRVIVEGTQTVRDGAAVQATMESARATG